MLFDNVVSLCKERNITIARLEKESGLGNATIRGWERGVPTIGTVKKVADYFGVTVDALLAPNLPQGSNAGENAERE